MINSLYNKYNQDILFKLIYIEEAHASDIWDIQSSRCNFGKIVNIQKHKTNIDRIYAAKQFKSNFNVNMPILIDTIDNIFLETYSAWPFQIYIIKNNKLIFQTKPMNQGNYDVFIIEDIIKSIL